MAHVLNLILQEYCQYGGFLDPDKVLKEGRHDRAN